MARRDVVVVGASAGGVEALRALVSRLPADFPAALLVVLHVPASSPSALPAILRRAGSLPVSQAEPEAEVRPGHVLVAAPDHHLVVYDGRVTLSRGPRENGHRPAVDVLFRSAARALGPRTIGIVLSGALDDGSAGLLAIRNRGGVGIVQSPDEALHRSMPENAIHAASPEHVVPIAEMPRLLAELVQQQVDVTTVPEISMVMEVETGMADLDPSAMHEPDRPGDPAGLSCPDCNGSLFTIREGNLVRYRCRVGHAWSSESLVAEQAASMESALWMALRTLEERAALTGDMSRRASDRGHTQTADAFERQHEEALNAANLIRELLGRAAAGAVNLGSPPRPADGQPDLDAAALSPG